MVIPAPLPDHGEAGWEVLERGPEGEGAAGKGG